MYHKITCDQQELWLTRSISQDVNLRRTLPSKFALCSETFSAPFLHIHSMYYEAVHNIYLILYLFDVLEWNYRNLYFCQYKLFKISLHQGIVGKFTPAVLATEQWPIFLLYKSVFVKHCAGILWDYISF